MTTDTTARSPRRRRRWLARFEVGEPLVRDAEGAQDWARRVHRPRGHSVPARASGAGKAGPPEEHLAARPFFGRYPLLGVGRTR